MKKIIEIENYKAEINYDPEIKMFRGEFLDLNGVADFYATDTEILKKEGKVSLDIYLNMCKADNIKP